MRNSRFDLPWWTFGESIERLRYTSRRVVPTWQGTDQIREEEVVGRDAALAALVVRRISVRVAGQTQDLLRRCRDLHRSTAVC